MVEVGAGHDGLRVVKDGLKTTDWFVLGNVEGLMPGMTVNPEKAAIPEPPLKPGKDSPDGSGKKQ